MLYIEIIKVRDLDVLPNARYTQSHGKWAEKDRNFAVTLTIEPVFMRVTREGVKIMVVLATLVGIPMYADIFGTIPVAEALLAKGAQLGTILSFMMAVTTLSLPSLIMLKKAVKPKLLTLFIAICTSGIIIVGYLFNIFSAIFI